MLASQLLTLGMLAALSIVLLTPRLRTGLLTSLLGWSPLLVAELRQLLTARLTLLAGPVSSTRGLVLGWLLVPGRWRSALCPSPLAAGLLTTLLLEASLPTSLALAIARRIPPWGLPSPTRLAGSRGGTLTATSPPLLVRRLPVVVAVPSSTLLFALALAAAVLLVHVVARPKVRRRANKRRPPFTWTGSERLC